MTQFRLTHNRFSFCLKAVSLFGCIIFMGGCASVKKLREPKVLLDPRDGVVPPPYMEPAQAVAAPQLPPPFMPPVATPLLPPPTMAMPALAPPAPVVKIQQIELPPTPHEAKLLVYEVQKGDSLSRIAGRYGVTVDELAALNNMQKTDVLHVGRKLQIPPGGRLLKPEERKTAPRSATSTKPAAKPQSGAPKTDARGIPPAGAGGRKPIPAAGKYNVNAGDSLWTISRDFGVSIQDIRTLNNLKSDVLQIGQTLVLRQIQSTPPKSAQPTSPIPPTQPQQAQDNAPEPVQERVPTNTTTVTEAELFPNILPHTVLPEETLELIGSYYGATPENILKLNPAIKSNADLKPGMELQVPYNLE